MPNSYPNVEGKTRILKMCHLKILTQGTGLDIIGWFEGDSHLVDFQSENHNKQIVLCLLVDVHCRPGMRKLVVGAPIS